MFPDKDRIMGRPKKAGTTKVLLLGSGELGREIAISLIRMGAWVCAADSYPDAPAAQVAQEHMVFDMADRQSLGRAIGTFQPDIIIPEIEALATDRLALAREDGIQVVPASNLASICMDRQALRVFAHEQVGLPTANYRFADDLAGLRTAAGEVGLPCVVKPVMSSSGHGQSVVRSADRLATAWERAQTEGRGVEATSAGTDGKPHDTRVIVESLVPLVHELTVLTVSSSAGIVTCPPIGQIQDDGDYRESWQPAGLDRDTTDRACVMARDLVAGLTGLAGEGGQTGWGLYGVELFVLEGGRILFNEVSPRPHDTGMVTMITQRLNEFDLHARALLGIPVRPEDVLPSLPPGWTGASRALLAEGEGPVGFSGLPAALEVPWSDLRIFSKPAVHGRRRMGVALAAGPDQETARKRTGLVLTRLQTHMDRA